MPPSTRATKLPRILKENVGAVEKTKHKSSGKVTKPARKVLADKTNSASDDNASIEAPKKTAKKTSILLSKENDNPINTRRERRLPNRFVDNDILKHLSNIKVNTPIAPASQNNNSSKGLSIDKHKSSKNEKHNSVKDDSTLASPFKTPLKVADTSLVAARPRRVSRLPSRFEDHSMSPHKFIPIQPFQASTPIVQKSAITIVVNETTPNAVTKSVAIANVKRIPKQKTFKESPVKKVAVKKTKKAVADTNNNGRTLRARKLPDTSSKQSSKESLKSSSKTVTLKKTKSPVKIISSKAVKGNFKNTCYEITKSPTKVLSPIKLKSPISSKAVKGTLKETSHQIAKGPMKVFNPIKSKSSLKHTSPKKKNKQTPTNVSFKILEENQKNDINQDVYEFTYDPEEEPAPQKKKRKAVKKKPSQPKVKTFEFKNNYDQNVNKALAALKHVVAKRTTRGNVNTAQAQSTGPNVTSKSTGSVPIIQVNGSTVANIDKAILRTQQNENRNEVKSVPHIQRNVASKIIINQNNSQVEKSNVPCDSNAPHIKHNVLQNVNDIQNTAQIQQNHTANKSEPNKSIRIEDIAADFESSPVHHDIDYSPVNSPARPKTPLDQVNRISELHHQDDPLNLKENASFFDQNPVASSSINTSVRHPQASPWRVDFGNLPIRWHVSSYVKPNMTPAVECSFVDYEHNDKRKHVYTNLVPESNDTLPEIIQNDQPNLKQSSIFSFIKKVVERNSAKKAGSSAKKSRDRSTTPITASLFSDTADKDSEKVKKSTRQLFTPKKNKNQNTLETRNVENTSSETENSSETSKVQKRKQDEAPNVVPEKTSRKEKHSKYFGFDDSEDLDLENLSPTKYIAESKRALRSRARGALKEINEQSGPTRGIIPAAIKNARNAEIERMCEDMKSASDAPVFPELEQGHIGTTNVDEVLDALDDDSQLSVHLFEDVEVVHHVKPHRKSYGKAKKVTFEKDTIDSDSEENVIGQGSDNSDADDDMKDLTFDPGVPFEEEKKTKKKLSKRQKMSKKEEQEADAWAAGFNSMCEDVEEFALVIE